MDCFVLPQLLSVARLIGRTSWDRIPPNFTLEFGSYRSALIRQLDYSLHTAAGLF